VSPRKSSKTAKPRSSATKVGIGAHVSVAGGFAEALRRAEEQRFDAMQIFTSSPRSRARRVVTPEEEREYLEELKETTVRAVYVHTPYYVNAASPDSRIWHFSKTYILRELAQMDRVNMRYFVMHVGSHRGVGEAIGKSRVVRMLKEVLAESKDSKTVICLENTAGQRNEVGSQMGDIAEILSQFSNQPRVGAVMDTCHMFSAGYDLRNAKAVAKTFSEIDKLIGWSRIPMLHFNDSKAELGGRRDRHEHIGKGKIGFEGMEAVVRSPFVAGKDLILETEPEGRLPDIQWLRKKLGRD
jgi:deoxyribonuclease-4